MMMMDGNVSISGKLSLHYVISNIDQGNEILFTTYLKIFLMYDVLSIGDVLGQFCLPQQGDQKNICFKNDEIK